MLVRPVDREALVVRLGRAEQRRRAEMRARQLRNRAVGLARLRRHRDLLPGHVLPHPDLRRVMLRIRPPGLAQPVLELDLLLADHRLLRAQRLERRAQQRRAAAVARPSGQPQQIVARPIDARPEEQRRGEAPVAQPAVPAALHHRVLETQGVQQPAQLGRERERCLAESVAHRLRLALAGRRERGRIGRNRNRRNALARRRPRLACVAAHCPAPPIVAHYFCASASACWSTSSR